MQEAKPYISIITVVKNAVHSIERCILSVEANRAILPPGYLEYIIIDGNSTDGTKDVIDKYKGKIEIYESTSDSGISEAFNKGLKLASGTWVLFVNADDWLVDNSLGNALILIDRLEENPTFITGAVNLWDNNKFIIESYSRIHNISRESSIHHASTFIKKEDIVSEKWFSGDLEYAMDYEFFLRLITIKGLQIIKIPLVIANRTLSGISYVNQNHALKETKRIRAQYFSNWNSLLWYYYAVVKDRIGRTLKANKYLFRMYEQIWKMWNNS